MSELLLDMEADQATASSIEKMDNTGLASVAEIACLLYTSPSPRDRTRSRMPSSA